MSAEGRYAGDECFVVLPLGEPGSVTRRAADGLLQTVARPVLDELGFAVEVARELTPPEAITLDTIDRLMDVELVLVDLTGANPSVMYALAVRDSMAEPAVVLAQEGTELPFEFLDERTVTYRDDMLGVEELRAELSVAVQQAMETGPASPIFTVARTKVLRELTAGDPIEETGGEGTPADEANGAAAGTPGARAAVRRRPVGEVDLGVRMRMVGDAATVRRYSERLGEIVDGDVRIRELEGDGTKAKAEWSIHLSTTDFPGLRAVSDEIAGDRRIDVFELIG